MIDINTKAHYSQLIIRVYPAMVTLSNNLNFYSMIEKLMTNSRTTEVADVSVRMIGAFGNTTLNTDPHMEGMFNNLGGQTEGLVAAIKRMKAESELEAKDETRDEKLRSLFYLVNGYVHHPAAETRDAAIVVKAVLDNYGDITGDSYSTESALIFSMLHDLSQPDIQAAIALLSGCSQLVEELSIAQNEFEDARIAWEEEKAEEGTQLSATVIKKEVVTTINESIVIYLRAMEHVNESTYGAFARTVAEIIDENNVVVKKRRKKPEEEPAA